MIAFDRYLYVFGGVADNTLPSDLYRYSTACLIIVNNNKKEILLNHVTRKSLKCACIEMDLELECCFLWKRKTRELRQPGVWRGFRIRTQATLVGGECSQRCVFPASTITREKGRKNDKNNVILLHGRNETGAGPLSIGRIICQLSTELKRYEDETHCQTVFQKKRYLRIYVFFCSLGHFSLPSESGRLLLWIALKAVKKKKINKK